MNQWSRLMWISALGTASLVGCGGSETTPSGGDGGSSAGGFGSGGYGTGTAIEVVTGGRDTCLLFDSNTLSCWGDLFNHSRPTPYALRDVEQLSVGDLHVCTRMSDDSARCWFRNLEGQLGDGTTIRRDRPTAVLGLSDVAAMEAGVYHSCALLQDGSVRCWGDNNEGAVGDGTQQSRAEPVAVAGLTDVRQLSCGWSFSCALHDDGTVSCWGGHPATDSGPDLEPTAVAGLTDVQQIAVGLAHVCALLSDGTVSCWGNGSALPTPVAGLSGVLQIGAGNNHDCALLSDGTVACWGDNTSGALGDGTLERRDSPVIVPGLADVVQLAVDVGSHNCVMTTSHELWCWGYNFAGQVGNGSTLDQLSPVQIEY